MSRVRRAAFLVLTVTAVGVVAAGAAVAGRGDPKEALSAADQARAKRMLLRPADLGAGLAGALLPPESDAYCRALDESDLTLTGEARSPQYTVVGPRGLRLLSSAARIYRSAAEATTSWRRSTGPAGVRCSRNLVAATSGIELRSFRAQPFPQLAPRTAAYRVVVDVAGRSGPIRMHSDIVVLQRGRAQAILSVLAQGRPHPRAETLALARAIARRQQAALGGT